MCLCLACKAMSVFVNVSAVSGFDSCTQRMCDLVLSSPLFNIINQLSSLCMKSLVIPERHLPSLIIYVCMYCVTRIFKGNACWSKNHTGR